MFIDDLILISGHISSKAGKNEKQIQGVCKDLKKLAEIFPNHKVVVGCDANTGDLDASEMSTKES